MAQETIDAIRQAETAAEAAEKEAVKEAEAIVAEAKAGAEEGKDLEALQKAVAEKQQKAVEVILSELL